ncbi:MAG: polysaccharide lyase family protein, partial [Planctomycetota bacterium]
MQRAIALALAVALAGPTAAGSGDEKHVTIFQLGEPDGLSKEFGGSRRLWEHYLDVFPKPVVFTVGESRLREWPYIHPSNMDDWAGGKPHTFTLNFSLATVPQRRLHLVIGLTDTCQSRPPLVTVAANGRKLPPWRPPHGTARGAFEPDTWAKPSNKVFPIPDGALHAGQNTITIHAETRSWMTYDYLRLGTDPQPVNLRGDAETLLEDFLAGPMRGVKDIVFAVRQPGRDGHWYANFSYYAPDTDRLTYGHGGKLCRLNLKTGERIVLLNDPQGAVRDPQVHYDARKVLFSYRKGGTPYYHLYEIDLDGTELRQLTDGPYDDIEPTYLADDGIMFCSSRARRWVNCWLTKVAVLYRCDADGSN